MRQQEKQKKSEASAGTLPRSQPTLADTLHKSKPYNQQSERYKKVTRKLSVFIAVGNVLNSIVECEEFRDLVKELDEQYIVPGRTSIGIEMDKVLIDLRANMGAALDGARKAAITADMVQERFDCIVLGCNCSFLFEEGSSPSSSNHSCVSIATPTYC